MQQWVVKNCLCASRLRCRTCRGCHRCDHELYETDDGWGVLECLTGEAKKIPPELVDEVKRPAWKPGGLMYV